MGRCTCVSESHLRDQFLLTGTLVLSSNEVSLVLSISTAGAFEERGVGGQATPCYAVAECYRYIPASPSRIPGPLSVLHG